MLRFLNSEAIDRRDAINDALSLASRVKIMRFRPSSHGNARMQRRTRIELWKNRSVCAGGTRFREKNSNACDKAINERGSDWLCYPKEGATFAKVDD
ncbi:hypothetical protein RB195_000804 [Necator americanus]|uniref:Uncharacterized protein n=1 Tax=Necator americanus TaxID=51031 RepID=A0ABR1DBF2_NECAM